MTDSPTVLSLTITAKPVIDLDKLSQALGHLATADPECEIRAVNDTETVLSGKSEPHLLGLVARLRDEFKDGLDAGSPQVKYREAITTPVRAAEGRHIKQSGGQGQYAHVVLDLDPLEPHGAQPAYEFADATADAAIPRRFIPSVEEGIQSARLAGVFVGYPVVDLKVTVTGGSYHEVNSSQLTFLLAAADAFRSAVRRAAPILLEPVMSVTVTTPGPYAAAVTEDLAERRGDIQAAEDSADGDVVHAHVPLSGLLGYDAALHTLTDGQGGFSMEFLSYTPAPPSVSEAILQNRH